MGRDRRKEGSEKPACLTRLKTTFLKNCWKRQLVNWPFVLIITIDINIYILRQGAQIFLRIIRPIRSNMKYCQLQVDTYLFRIYSEECVENSPNLFVQGKCRPSFSITQMKTMKVLQILRSCCSIAKVSDKAFPLWFFPRLK